MKSVKYMVTQRNFRVGIEARQLECFRPLYRVWDDHYVLIAWQIKRALGI